MSLPTNSRWRIERDVDGPGSTAPQTIKVVSTNGATFTASYTTNVSNLSVFTGEVRTRETKVLSLRQHDAASGYAAFHVAHRQGLTNDNVYVGRWYDNAGNIGNFRLTRL